MIGITMPGRIDAQPQINVSLPISQTKCELRFPIAVQGLSWEIQSRSFFLAVFLLKPHRILIVTALGFEVVRQGRQEGSQLRTPVRWVRAVRQRGSPRH